MSGKQIVVGITGASGALYAGRLLRALLIGGHQVHLVLSKYGRYLLVEELGFRPDKESLRAFITRCYGEETQAGDLCEYNAGDLSAPIASGSVRYRRHGGGALFGQDAVEHRSRGVCEPN